MSSSINKYAVKKILLSNGERLSILLDRRGLPIFEANMFALTDIRGRNLASNTIQQALRAVMVFYIFLDALKIDLQARLNEGNLLALHEIEALATYCRMPLTEMWGGIEKAEPISKKSKIVSFENVRQRLLPAKTSPVVPAFTLTRLLYIRNYLVWLVNSKVSRHEVSPDMRRKLLETRELIFRGITARLPSKDGRGNLGGREGMTPEEQKILFRVVAAQSDENPWFDVHTRVRNELMIRWLLGFGMRRGELLNLRISDISFRKKEVTVTRDADDIADPRLHQPLSKTNARTYDIPDRLLFMTQEYILHMRYHLPLACKHEFLFVAADGNPLSLSSFTKVFSSLRAKCPFLPQNLCGHTLRHSWNENFSDQSDLAGWGDAEEMRYREYLQGWVHNSGTAARYCKRGIRRRANLASLELQERLERSE